MLNAIERTPVAIVTDREFLCQKSAFITEEECESLGIWETLRMVLDKFPNGLGLSAIQIGIPVRACIMLLPGENGKLQEKRILNPEIMAKSSNYTTWEEGCLSFPGETIRTSRNVGLVVNDDISGENVYSGIAGIVIQHEIDHMDGILFHSRRVHTIKRENPKVGRNDLCICGSGKKYKRCCGK